MDVTIEMVVAAVKQAVKDEVLPSHEVSIDTYTHHYDSVRRMLEKALDNV